MNFRIRRAQMRVSFCLQNQATDGASWYFCARFARTSKENLSGCVDNLWVPWTVLQKPTLEPRGSDTDNNHLNIEKKGEVRTSQGPFFFLQDSVGVILPFQVILVPNRCRWLPWDVQTLKRLFGLMENSIWKKTTTTYPVQFSSLCMKSAGKSAKIMKYTAISLCLSWYLHRSERAKSAFSKIAFKVFNLRVINTVLFIQQQ